MKLLPPPEGRVYDGQQGESIALVFAVDGSIYHLRIEGDLITTVVHHKIAVDEQSGDAELDLKPVFVGRVKDLGRSCQGTQGDADETVADLIMMIS